MADIFISYSHQDTQFAHHVAESLKQNGFTVWIDDRINYGSEWPQVIQESLDNCRAFVVIMSPRSYKSEWVQNELAYARSKQKPLFPLLLEGDLWVSVAATQYTDVRSAALPPQLFFDTVERTLGSKGSVTQPVPVVMRPSVTPNRAGAPAAQAKSPMNTRLVMLGVIILILILGAGFLILTRRNNGNTLNASDQQATVIAENFNALSATTTQIAANFNAYNTPVLPLDATPAPREAGVINETDILGNCDDKNYGEARKTFKQGIPLSIYWSWSAKTSDEVSQEANSANYQVSVDGITLDAWQNYRTEITRFSDGLYYVYWFVPIGRPSVGQHSINFKITWTKLITDGETVFGPGTAIEQYVSTCGFTVN